MKTKGKPRFFFLFYLPELRKLETLQLGEDLVTAFRSVFTCFSRLPFNSSFSHTVAQHVGPCESSILLLSVMELQQLWIAEFQKGIRIWYLSQSVITLNRKPMVLSHQRSLSQQNVYLPHCQHSQGWFTSNNDHQQ